VNYPFKVLFKIIEEEKKTTLHAIIQQHHRKYTMGLSPQQKLK